MRDETQKTDGFLYFVTPHSCRSVMNYKKLSFRQSFWKNNQTLPLSL